MPIITVKLELTAVKTLLVWDGKQSPVGAPVTRCVRWVFLVESAYIRDSREPSSVQPAKNLKTRDMSRRKLTP